MKIDLDAIWKELRLPIGLTLLFASILGLLGLSLDQIVNLAGSLVGLAAAIGLLLDVLKWAGVLNAGWAGKVSAIINLAVLIGIAALLKFYPTFDFASADVQFAEFAKTFSVVFAYIVQLVSAKSFHNFLVRGVGIQSFRLT